MSSSKPTTLDRIQRGATITQEFEIVIFVVLLFIAALVTDLSWSDRATLANTFATISGVFLGLWFVVKSQQAKQNPRHVTLFLLISVLVSLISSIDSLDRTNSPFASKYTIWLVSVVVFAFSSAYFAVQSEVFE